MDRIVKVFCEGDEQGEVAASHVVVERYKGFVILSVSPRVLAALSRRFLLEDITDLYVVRVAGREIGTGRSGGGDAARRGKPPGRPPRVPGRPESGRHHYLLQFIGPIKPAWLRAVRAAGAEPRVPYQNFTYVVRADPRALRKLAALRQVRRIVRLPYWARMATALRERESGAPGAARLPRTRVIAGTYTVEFFGVEDMTGAAPRVAALKARVLAREPAAPVMTVRIEGSAAAQRRVIAAISRVHGVRSIRERSLKRTSNDVAAGIMGTAASMSAGGLGLSGKGEIIGICDTGLDTGDPQTVHPDFRKRIAAITSYPITADFADAVDNPGADDGPADLDSGHGTHVSGSALGSGAASAGLPGQVNLISGLAPGARLVFQAVEQEMKWKDPSDAQRYGRYVLAGLSQDLARVFDFARRKGARIHSNSWGGGDPGAYDASCEQLDGYVWKHRDFCIVVAAGNDGRDGDRDGRVDPMSVSSPGTAKNCITVGASESRRPAFCAETYGAWWPQDYPAAPLSGDPMADDPDQVAAFSSRGPTLDNRIKPDVVAPGTFILSTRASLIASNNTGWAAYPPSSRYFSMGGTSMATPLAAGAAAVVREYLVKRAKMKNPGAALVKAALVAGARRLPPGGTAVFDHGQGFGRVDLDAVLAPPRPTRVQFLENTPGLGTGDVERRSIEVLSAKVPLRVVLVYTDYPGRSLVNNLNLIVRGPARAAPRGAGRGPARKARSPERPAGKPIAGNLGDRPDNSNNVEVVEIPRPATGAWEIQVVGSNVPHGPQPFALVVRGDYRAVSP